MLGIEEIGPEHVGEVHRDEQAKEGGIPPEEPGEPDQPRDMQRNRQRTLPVLARLAHEGRHAHAAHEHREVGEDHGERMARERIPALLRGLHMSPDPGRDHWIGADGRSEHLRVVLVMVVVGLLPHRWRIQGREAHRIHRPLAPGRLPQDCAVHVVVEEDEEPNPDQAGHNRCHELHRCPRKEDCHQCRQEDGRIGLAEKTPRPPDVLVLGPRECRAHQGRSSSMSVLLHDGLQHCRCPDNSPR